MKNPMIVSNVVDSTSKAFYTDAGGVNQPLTKQQVGAETNIMDATQVNKVLSMMADQTQRQAALDSSAIQPMSDVFTFGGGTGYHMGPYSGHTDMAASVEMWVAPKSQEITAQTGNVVYTSSDGSTTSNPGSQNAPIPPDEYTNPNPGGPSDMSSGGDPGTGGGGATIDTPGGGGAGGGTGGGTEPPT